MASVTRMLRLTAPVPRISSVTVPITLAGDRSSVNMLKLLLRT